MVAKLSFQGYTQSKLDYSLFFKKNSSTITFVVVYVDDVLVTRNDPIEIAHLKQHLDSVFNIKDLGILHYFLCIEVSYKGDHMILTQAKFTKELLNESGLHDFRKAVTPLPANLKLNASDGQLLCDGTFYRSMVGKLNFLTNTMPVLSYSVQTLSQYMHAKPSKYTSQCSSPQSSLCVSYLWARDYASQF